MVDDLSLLGSQSQITVHFLIEEGANTGGS
jgi:hypothetical protein